MCTHSPGPHAVSAVLLTLIPATMGLSPATACTPFGACLSCEYEDMLARGRAEGGGEVEGEGEPAA